MNEINQANQPTNKTHPNQSKQKYPSPAPKKTPKPKQSKKIQQPFGKTIQNYFLVLGFVTPEQFSYFIATLVHNL